jgi:hypothetical protein
MCKQQITEKSNVLDNDKTMCTIKLVPGRIASSPVIASDYRVVVTTDLRGLNLPCRVQLRIQHIASKTGL